MTEEAADRSSLSAAAAALEAELRRYEELAADLLRGRLASEKDLRRAAQTLRALQSSDTRLGELVRALVAAIGVARDDQQARAEAVQARAGEIQARSETLTRLVARWETLGADAAEVNRMAQQSAGDSNGGEGREKLARTAEELHERLGRLAEDARGLVQAADAENFVDLARRADSLREQLLSARSKLRGAAERR